MYYLLLCLLYKYCKILFRALNETLGWENFLERSSPKIERLATPLGTNMKLDGGWRSDWGLEENLKDERTMVPEQEKKWWWDLKVTLRKSRNLEWLTLFLNTREEKKIHCMNFCQMRIIRNETKGCCKLVLD